MKKNVKQPLRMWMYKGALTVVDQIPYNDRLVLFKHKISPKANHPHPLEK